MNNEVIFKNLQTSYDSLKYFIIKNNILYFKDDNNVYTLPLISTNLNTINPNLYLLKPRDIYRVIFLLELLNKDILTENDIEFINQYTNKYLKLETMRLENQNVDENEVTSLSVPIYTSYDPKYINKPASKIINELLSNYSQEIENGRSSVQTLALKPKNIPDTIIREDYEDSPLNDFKQAGFTAIILIISTVVLTSLYIFFFILSK